LPASMSCRRNGSFGYGSFRFALFECRGRSSG
jgi:hypothetical protein